MGIEKQENKGVVEDILKQLAYLTVESEKLRNQRNVTERQMRIFKETGDLRKSLVDAGYVKTTEEYWKDIEKVINAGGLRVETANHENVEKVDNNF